MCVVMHPSSPGDRDRIRFGFASNGELSMIGVAVYHLVSKSCSMLCAKMHACNQSYALYKLPMMMKSVGQKFH